MKKDKNTVGKSKNLGGRNMKIINTKEIAQEIKDAIRVTMPKGVVPKLVILQVEGDKASDSYVKNKVKLGKELGIEVEHTLLKNDIPQKKLEMIIEHYNADRDTSGIIVQLPLPNHLDERKALDTIDVEKDVDGLGTKQIGRLTTQNGRVMHPCTALGVINMLINITELEGKDVVIVNRSNLIGKPLQIMLTNEDATVTMCHSRTKNLKEKIQNADIVITGIGKAKFFDKSYFKDGQIIIDCSMNVYEGKLCGDVKIEDLEELDVLVASGTGHTGVMTVLSLMYNTLMAKIWG